MFLCFVCFNLKITTGLRRLAVLRFYVFDGGHGSLLRPCRVLLAVQDHLSGF